MKSLKIQEWADITGMYATCSDAGNIILHEKKPSYSRHETLKRTYNYIWESNGLCCYLIRDMVGGDVDCSKLYSPRIE